jgi:tRNA(Ile)-lysidine synthase
MIQKRFKNKIEELKGLINDDSWSVPVFLLAVSGGMDSMCMADLFVRTCGLSDIAIAHCNFNLRNDESDGDESLVREWAAQWNLKVHVISFDTVSYAKAHDMSIEMAARELRYAWFARLCLQHGYSYVAVAHHADDNAETMLLNMTRGTGIKGMTGMKNVSELPCPEVSVPARLARPMLGFTRKQIEGYVLKHKVPFRNDSSNFSVDYRRNRIRHEIFPVMKKLNPSFVSTLNREMAYLEDASGIVDEWCRTVERDIVTQADENIRISIEKLLSHKQWRYLLYHILEPYGFNSATLASIENLLLSDRTVSGKRFLSETHELITERKELVMSELHDDDSDEGQLVINEAGLYRFNDVNIVVEICPWTKDMPLKQPEGVQIFDASKLEFPIVFRRWSIGDWLIPLGMRGKRKVSDIFSDMKYDSAAKNNAIVMTDGTGCQRIAALLWVRMDSRYKVDAQTDTIIRISKR